MFTEVAMKFRKIICKVRMLAGYLRVAYVAASVTRWIDYLFNIWPFTMMKNFPF